MYEIKLSEEAISDLEGIKDYITVDLSNEQAADNTIKNILRSIRRLEEFPNIGTLLSDVVGFDTNFRFVISGNYMVFYKLNNDIVYIVRILYGKRNYLNILFE